MNQEVVLCVGKRTPFGGFSKSVIDVPGPGLGIHAAKACLDAIGLADESPFPPPYSRHKTGRRLGSLISH